MAAGAEYPSPRPDGVLRLLDYAGHADCIRLKDVSMTSGSSVATSATAQWSIFDIGKFTVTQGAGAGTGVQLPSTIVSVQSPGQCTLANNASTTVTNATFDYGTDNTAAINAMLAAGTPPTLSTYGEAGGSAAVINNGVFGFTGIIFVPSNVGCLGAGSTLTVLRALGASAQFRAANPAGRTQTAQITILNQGGTLSGVLSGATLTVTSTADIAHPSAPGFTSSGSLKTAGGGIAAQTYTYTSKDATHFYGVSGGTAGVVVPDGVCLQQGDTSGSRGAAIGQFTVDGNNIAGSSTQPLVLWGKVVQRRIVDFYTVNSWGDGEWWMVAQNCRNENHNVENNRGTGVVFDVGTGGHEWIGFEWSSNGRNNGYNFAFRESMKSPNNYLQPTDIHFVGGVCERGGVDQSDNVTQLGQGYFGAYNRITFTSVNFAGQRPGTSITAALVGGEATIPINSFAAFPVAVGSGGTVVIGNDLITFTGSTPTSLTGCSGVAAAHPYWAAVNWVDNSALFTGRDDNVNGTNLGTGLRFHNCIFQGDVGNNGVQGSGYVGNSVFDFQAGGGGRGAPGFATTGRNQVVGVGNIYKLDDTATDVFEQPGSMRTTAAPVALPGATLVNWLVNAGGGTKTADQLVRVFGDRGPTTAGTPTDTLLGSATNPIYDGITVVDRTNTRLYYRNNAAYQRVANYSDIAPITFVYCTSDTTALASQTVIQPDPTLLFTLNANDVYHFEAWMLFNAANITEDLKIGWTGPSGFTGFWGSVGGTANVNNGWGPATSAGTPVILTQAQSQSYGSAAGDFGYAISGIFMGDGVHSGTVTLCWAQNTSDAGSLIRKKGSLMILSKVQ